MIRLPKTALPLAVLTLLAGCGPDYSPNTYNANAVQQANKVERGEIIGVRQIQVSAAGVVGAATGAAAGGAAGAQAPGGGFNAALGAIGGGLVGGIIGNSVEHATADTFAYEYIVRKTNNDMVSVTQKDTVPLKVGTKVLVIAGNQARIVPDYTTDPEPPKPAADDAAKQAGNAADKPAADTTDAKPAADPAAPAASAIPAQTLPTPATTESLPAPVAASPLFAPAAPAATQ